MVRSFVGALRLAQSRMLPQDTSAPPCGGVGIPEWDFLLAVTFISLQHAKDDEHRLDILERHRWTFSRRAVMVEAFDLSVRHELLTVAAKLGEWTSELQGDMLARRAA